MPPNSVPFRDELRDTARLAGPVAMAQIGLVIMSLVDAACVGRHSELALGAVGLGGALSFAVMIIAMGVAFALEPLASSHAPGSGPWSESSSAPSPTGAFPGPLGCRRFRRTRHGRRISRDQSQG